MEQVELKKTLDQQIEKIHDENSEYLGIDRSVSPNELATIAEMNCILDDLKLTFKVFKFDYFDGEDFRYIRKYGKNKLYEAIIWLNAKDGFDPCEDAYCLLNKENLTYFLLIFGNTITNEYRRVELKLS